MWLRGLALGALVLVAGCGSDAPSDREQIVALVDDFFADTAHKDVKAVCAVLTENGWAHAVYRKFVVDAPLRSADEHDCIRLRAPAAMRSVDLPAAFEYGHRPSVERLRLLGDRAQAVVTFLGQRRWAFRKTEGVWKIESFSLPVRE